MNTNSIPSMTYQSESLQTSPQQATFGSQYQNQNIPDLKAVMFPSDNPFAYGNQAISTLEGSQQDVDSQSNNYSNGETYMTTGQTVNSNMPYEVLYNMPASYMQHQNPQSTGPSINNVAYPTMGQMDASLASPDISSMPAGPGEGGFWQQMNAGGRTGFTPGIASTVNFDELFGNEQWQSGWAQNGYPQSS